MAGEIKFLLPADSSYSIIQNFDWNIQLREVNNRVIIGGIVNDGIKNRLQSLIFSEGFAWYIPRGKVLPDESTAISDSIVVKPIPYIESSIQQIFLNRNKLIPQFYIIENIKFLSTTNILDWIELGNQYGMFYKRFFTNVNYIHSKEDKTIHFKPNFFLTTNISADTNENNLYSGESDEALFGLKILSKTNDYIDPSFFFKFLKKYNSDLFDLDSSWVDTLPSNTNIHFFNEVGLPYNKGTIIEFAESAAGPFSVADHFEKHGNEHYSSINPPIGHLKFSTTEEINAHVFISLYPSSNGASSAENFILFYQMADSFDQICCQIVNVSDWLSNQPTGSSLRYYSIGNKVKALIDGQQTYREIFSTINETSQATDFVYIAGWSIDMNFKIISLANHLFFNKTLKEILTIIDERNVKIRCLFWDADEVYGWLKNFYNLIRAGIATVNVIRTIVDPEKKVSLILRLIMSPQAQATTLAKRIDLVNQLRIIGVSLSNLVFKDEDITLRRPSCEWINQNLSNAKAIADHKVRNLQTHNSIGSHHQKLIVVKASENLYGFCGGIDIYADRAKPHSDQLFPGQHDVHCKIEGPAVKDMWLTFKQRWEDQEESNNETLPQIQENEFRGSCLVQIARTYGSSVGYSFTSGEQIISQTLIKAILKAQKTIYIEDQYCIHPDFAGLLNSFVKRPNFEGLAILIPHWDSKSVFAERVRRFLDIVLPLNDPEITAEIREKVFVFHVDNGTEDYTYIHAKIMIIDDFLVTIGSANLNYRSHTHDSEINAMIIDTELAEGKRKFARDLRINLWKEHLNIMSSKEAELKLSNFSIGLECLKKSIRIKKFNAPILSADSLIDDNLYNMLVDPIS